MRSKRPPRLAQEGLDAGLAPGDILDKGFVKGIEEVGDLFGKGEFFLPELVQGAEAMKAAVAVLQPAIDAAGGGRRRLGVAVAGTVAGDIHEIGKTIVCSMLSRRRLHGHRRGLRRARRDLRRQGARRSTPTCCCSPPCSPRRCPTSRRPSRRSRTPACATRVKVMIGGAPTTRAWADEIGADGYAEDAIEAVATAKTILGVG